MSLAVAADQNNKINWIGYSFFISQILRKSTQIMNFARGSMDKALKAHEKTSKVILNSEGGHMVSSYEEWVGYVDSFVHQAVK